MGCAHSGNSGSGMIRPLKMVAAAGSNMPMPSPEMVQNMLTDTRLVMAALSRTAATVAAAQAAPLASEAGGCNPRNSMATMNIGRARSTAGAVLHAMERMYQ